MSPRSFNRIKSAHPLNYDREKLMEENINLKTQLNKFRNDMASTKKEITSLENELVQKDKIIEEMMSESNVDGTSSKINEKHLVLNLKKQYKELKKENEKILKDNEQLKKNIKSSKLNEMTLENKVLSEQVEKLKNLYNHSQQQFLTVEQNVYDYNVMKEALSKQDYIILNFQENYQKMTEDIKNLNGEIEKVTKIKNEKVETINKLKQKLKLQYQINEKLVMTRENIRNTDEFIQMKNKYEGKLQKLRKDLAYYKDSNAKNERMLRDIKSIQNSSSPTSQQTHMNTLSETFPRSNNIISSNPTPHIQKDPSEQNSKILLLQSKYLEEKNEKEKLIKKVEDLENQLANAKKTETKVIVTNSFSNQDTGIAKPIKITEYEYLNDFTMNELTYILLKNLEANKIDMSIIESRVITSDSIKLLNNEKNYKTFISQISQSLCEILKIQQEKDQIDVHSFIKTFLYNYYISKRNNDNGKTTPEEFKNKLLSLFDNINFYSIEQKQELNKIICSKVQPIKDKMISLFQYFDENNSGYITFTTLKKITEETKLKLKNESLEYFIYIMKSFKEEGRYLKDLKYENLIKIINDTQLNPNEHINEDEDEKEDEDEAIEITNEEYLNKVKEIIGKICKVLKEKNKKLDDYFIKALSKSVNDFKAIQLINLVDILKNDFNIELTHLEIFCLFTKIKPGDSQKEEDDVEEIIDYDKLKKEIETYMKSSEEKVNNIELPNEIAKKQKNVIKSDDGFGSGRTPKNKLSNLYDPSAQAIEKEDDPKEMILNHLKKNKISYERFIFPIHCMMKLTSNGRKFNRYVDIEIFKHLLMQNSLLIYTESLMKFLSKEKLLFNDSRVNLDYLKFLLSGQKGVRDNKINDFMLYKPMKDNKKEDNDSSDDNKSDKKKGNDNSVFEESESMRMLQKEIYGDDGEIEEIKNNNI